MKSCKYEVRPYGDHWEVWETTDDAWVKDFNSRSAAEYFIQQRRGS